MTANTKIEWCNATVNWWAGCMKVSPACDNCYAERMAGRLWGTKWGPDTPRHPFQGPAKALRALNRKAARLGRPLKVFHNSVSDMFDTAVPDAWRMDAFQCMANTPNLIHLLLTKRIGNAAKMMFHARGGHLPLLANLWIGTTICNQEEADRDIPKLLAVPAAKRFLSMEPLLGPVDLTVIDVNGDAEIYPLRGTPGCVDSEGEPCDDVPALDWIIVGGESGPNARPMHPDWARSLRDQCQAAGVPFFFKQWGEWIPADQSAAASDAYGRALIKEFFHLENHRMHRIGKKSAGRLLDGREWNEVPQ